MLVALWRHAENYKEQIGFQAHAEPDNYGRPIDPIVTPIGSFNAGHIAMTARTGVMQSVKGVFIASSCLERAKLTRFYGVSAFDHQWFGPEGSNATQLDMPNLDAETAEEYFSVFHFLQNVAKFCTTNNFKQPQAIILITHAHNVLGQLLERFLDKDFATYTPEEAVFLDGIIQDFQSGRIGFLKRAMDSGEYEKFRKALTNPISGHKPEYSEMRVFDAEKRKHLETIKPPWVDYNL